MTIPETLPAPLIESIGNLLWSVFPPEASKINLQAMIYADFNMQQLTWLVGGETRWSEHAQSSDEFRPFYDEAMKQLQQAQTAATGKNRWDHVTVSLTSQQKIEFRFAFVPAWDSWPGLFMKRASELTPDEAKKAFLDDERPAEFKRLRAEHDGAKGN
jgi:hypothetical protein